MKRLMRLFGSRIKNKLALLSVIPVAVVTAIITWHTIVTSSAQIKDFQLQTAVQVAENLATMSDFALYSGREDLLLPMAKSASTINAISSILFLTPERELLLSPPLPESMTPEMLRFGRYQQLASHLQVFEEPVYQINVDFTDFPESDQPQQTLLGWVVVIADDTEALKHTEDTVITHLLISFSVLLGAIILSYVLSNNVVSPITAMTAVVRELEKGDLNARIVPSTGDELAILANGINHLAKAVAEGRDNLENRVELATQRLRNTLDDLQQNYQELESARKEAEQASAAKGEFLAQMSHELRTPITAIQGFVNLLTASNLEPSQKRYCTIIQQASNQLLQLIDDILDITRLQSNAVVIDNAPFDLAECVETPLSLMASTAHEKGLELILDIAPTVPYLLKGDSLRVRQIIFNLISNAIKFTPAGYVCLKVRALRQNSGEVVLVMQVVDTGIGVPDKDKVKLFDSFSQADNSISRRFGGSGLGLSIVKRLVKLMNGTLQLDSTAGKGSCFTIELPFETAEVQQATVEPIISKALLFDCFDESRQALEHRLSRYAAIIESCEDFSDLEISSDQQAPDQIIYSAPVSYTRNQLEPDLMGLRQLYSCPLTVLTPATTAYRELNDALIEKLQPIHFIDKPPHSSDLARIFSDNNQQNPDATGKLSNALAAHILVVEDNEFTRILLSAFFEGSRCRLTMAENGREAIEAANQKQFDMILMDVHMPEVNGLTALRTIRSESGPNKSTPIIMLTADILQQEENALFDAGASDLMFKPFKEQKLINCIHKHLQREISGTSPAPAEATDTRLSKQRQLFTDEIARLTTLAADALADRQEALLRDATHQLLGIAGVYQMNHLERAVQALHKAIKTGDGNKMFAAMETLQGEVEKLQQESRA